MNITDLTGGNWTQHEALGALERYYNAKCCIDRDDIYAPGTILVRRASTDDEYGWLPASDEDLPAILAIEV